MCDGLNYMEQFTKYMLEAINEAKLAALEDEVPIGCIIVKDDQIIARAHNLRETTHDPLGHAETLAIKKASEILNDWQLVGCDLYVTIEPCIMCTGAIIQSRIRNVYYGSEDPKGGGLVSSLKISEIKNLNHYPNIEGGILKDECSNIVKEYFANKRKNKTLG